MQPRFVIPRNGSNMISDYYTGEWFKEKFLSCGL